MDANRAIPGVLISTKNVSILAKNPIVGGVPNIEAKVRINNSLTAGVLLLR